MVRCEQKNKEQILLLFSCDKMQENEGEWEVKAHRPVHRQAEN